MPLKILLADDHTLLRESLCKMLAETPGIEVAGAGDGRACFPVVQSGRPGRRLRTPTEAQPRIFRPHPSIAPDARSAAPSKAPLSRDVS